MTDTASIDRAFGWGLALEPLDAIDGAAGGLDLSFATVRGTDALLQSLTLALVTLAGSDVFNTGFGFAGLSALAEETDPVLRRERLRMAVIATLKAEPRITRIVTVRFADEITADGTTAAVFTTPPSRVLDIEAVFETVAGTRQAITLGGEVLDVR